MSHGLRVWGPDSTLQMDESTFTVRVVLSQVVTFGSAAAVQSFSVPGCTPSNAVAIVIPNGSYSDGARQFEPALGDGVVTVANYLRNWPYGAQNATGSMRLLVMRFN